MSRSVRGNNLDGYYGSTRCIKVYFAKSGAKTKRFTHKRERLQNRELVRAEHQTFEIERNDPPELTDHEQFMDDLYRDEVEAGLFDDYDAFDEADLLEEEALRQEEEDAQNAAYESLMDDWDWAYDFTPR